MKFQIDKILPIALALLMPGIGMYANIDQNLQRDKLLNAIIEGTKEALNITVSGGFFTKELDWKRTEE